MFRYDITFCGNKKCKKYDCRRHHKNTPVDIPYSMAFFNEENKRKCDNYLNGDKKQIKGIMIDFDNTAYNTSKAIVNLYHDDYCEYSDYKYVDWRDIKTWEFSELELASEDVINAYFNQQRFFRTIEPMKNFEIVAWLLRKDYKLTFCSHGYSPNLRQKQKFIARNYPNDDFIGVNLKTHKDKSCVDMSDCIFIDDTAKNLESSNAAIKILFGPDFEFNKEWDGIRCHTWDEVLFEIRRLEENGVI